MKMAILDDYQGQALSLANWSSLSPQVRITSFSTNFPDLGAAANALADFDIVLAMRERQRFPRALFERLPRLKCLVTTGPSNVAIDFAAAHDWPDPIGWSGFSLNA